METYYGQRRTYFHNVRFSYMQDKELKRRTKKFGYPSVSEYIRAAALDDEIKVTTEVYQSPVKKDYTVLIKSVVETIRILGKRMLRAQNDFERALNFPGTDPELINRHATRLRLITATLANCMNELITLLGEGHEPAL